MNKTFYLFGIILTYLSSIVNFSVYGQNKYEENVKIAEALFAKQQFLDAAKHYSAAFQSNGNLGSSEHRYKAARSWALAGMSDSAFYQLDKIITGNYNNVSEISTDKAFQSLAQDPRWKKVLESVRENRMVTEQFLAYIAAADKHMQAKRYSEAAKMFSTAFKYKPDYAADRYMYRYAICLVKSGKVDSALTALSTMSKNGYKNYLQIATDLAFLELHGDERWRKIIEDVKFNSASTLPNTTLARALDTIFHDDQIYRLQFEPVRIKYGRNSDEIRYLEKNMRKNDSVNIRKVADILDKHGWPNKEEIGKQGYNTLFLVIQHANVTIQMRYLDMIKEAVKEGSLPRSHLAILEDRIAVSQGKPQIYGSQLATNKKTGKYYVQKLADPNLVNQKRAEVGLPSMETYLSTWKMTWSLGQYFKDLEAALKDNK